jgi:hypothetical protein
MQQNHVRTKSFGMDIQYSIENQVKSFERIKHADG